jgi:hypothetical protein
MTYGASRWKPFQPAKAPLIIMAGYSRNIPLHLHKLICSGHQYIETWHFISRKTRIVPSLSEDAKSTTYTKYHPSVISHILSFYYSSFLCSTHANVLNITIHHMPRYPVQPLSCIIRSPRTRHLLNSLPYRHAQ